jgi:hypothetical protein
MQVPDSKMADMTLGSKLAYVLFCSVHSGDHPTRICSRPSPHADSSTGSGTSHFCGASKESC